MTAYGRWSGSRGAASQAREPLRFLPEVLQELAHGARESLRLLGRGFTVCIGSRGAERDVLHRECLVLLYRLLFIFYAEHRRLLPLDNERYASQSLTRLTQEIAGQLDSGPPFAARRTALWGRLATLFEAIEQGDDELSVPAYSGWLFSAKEHPLLAQAGPGDRDLAQAIDLLARTRAPGSAERHFIDYRELDIRHLGGIHERLLEYKLELADTEMAVVTAKGSRASQRYEPYEPERHGGRPPESLIARGDTYLVPSRGERHASGSFYTPDFLVQYLVAETLEPLVRGRSPAELLKLRIVDTAMGSGHFLLEAVDFLARAYARAVEESGEESLQPSGEDALIAYRRLVAERCIYGADLNPMAVELARLTLWLKTMARGHALTSLDHGLKPGNSLLAARGAVEAAAPLAGERHFSHWELMFPEVFYDKRGHRRADAGFDAIVGNPPWVRQEFLKADKEALKRLYPEVHAGAADTYVYFIAAALRLLAPQGRVGLVLPNKWLRADYARGLREHLLSASSPRLFIDFGHADIFPDTDTFPCLLVASREPPEPKAALRCCPVQEQERQELGETFDLSTYVRQRGYPVDPRMLRPEGWYPHPPDVARLIRKLWRLPRLGEVVRTSPLNGLKTGRNEAFLISQAARDRLVKEDPSCEPLLRKFLRGEDVERWSPRWSRQWLIALSSSENRAWPWAQAGTDKDAERIFRATYPSLHQHMKQHEQALKRREDQGRFWWELRSCDYYERFNETKIVYQEIQFLSQFALDEEGVYLNNKVFFIPGGSYGLLAALNSSLMWWYQWYTAPHMKDDAFALQKYYVEQLPVAEVSGEHAEGLCKLSRERQRRESEFLEWLRHELGLARLTERVQRYWEDEEEGFLSALRASGAELSPRQLRRVKEEWQQARSAYVPLVARARRLERELHEEVMRAYGLSARERELVRQTAPPRDPWELGEPA